MQRKKRKGVVFINAVCSHSVNNINGTVWSYIYNFFSPVSRTRDVLKKARTNLEVSHFICSLSYITYCFLSAYSTQVTAVCSQYYILNCDVPGAMNL